MKENSRIRMKMSTANELFTTCGSASSDPAERGKRQQAAQSVGPCHQRTLPPPRPFGLKASVSSSIANTTIRPESAPTY